MKIYTMEWKGPFFCLEDIKYDNELYNGIYAFIGIRKYKKYNKENIKLQYIGKTKNLLYTRLTNHHKLKYINRELSIWFGRITNTNNYNLEHIEHMFISFSLENDTINEKKTMSYPKTSSIIVSTFIKHNGDSYINLPKSVRCIPEIVIWDKKCRDSGILRYTSRLHIKNVYI